MIDTKPYDDTEKRIVVLTMLPMSSSERQSDSKSLVCLNWPYSYSLANSEFAESTILTIAHRLRTIIDYDRVRPSSSKPESSIAYL